jgi:hypothetical protein
MLGYSKYIDRVGINQDGMSDKAEGCEGIRVVLVTVSFDREESTFHSASYVQALRTKTKAGRRRAKQRSQQATRKPYCAALMCTMHT